MTLKITTESNTNYIIIAVGSVYRIMSSDVDYLKDLIEGCEVKQPKVLMPLVILLNKTDVLYTSRIKEITRI